MPGGAPKRKALAELDQNRGGPNLYEPKRGRENHGRRAVSLVVANVEKNEALPSEDDASLLAQVGRVSSDPEALGLMLCRTPSGPATSALVQVMRSGTQWSRASLYKLRTQAAEDLEAIERGSPQLFRPFRTVRQLSRAYILSSQLVLFN